MAENIGLQIQLSPKIESASVQAAVEKAAARTKLTIPEVHVKRLVLSKAAQKALDINSVTLKKIDARAAITSLKKDLESIFAAMQVDGLKISIKDTGLEAVYQKAADGASDAARRTSEIGAELDAAQKKAAALGSVYKSAFSKLEQTGQGGSAKEDQLTQKYTAAKNAYTNYINAIKAGNADLIASTKQQATAAEAALSEVVNQYKLQGDALSKFNSQITQLKNTSSALGSMTGVDQSALSAFNDQITAIEREVSGLDSLTGQAFTDTKARIEGAISAAKTFGSSIKSAAAGISNDLNPVYNLLNQIKSFRDSNSRIIGTEFDVRMTGIEESLRGIIKNGSYAKTALQNLREGFNEVKVSAAEAGATGKSFITEISRVASSIGGLMLARQVFMYARQGAREMYNAVKEVDDAMTQLKIVTQGTDAQMRRFFEASAESANKLGKSVSDVLDSVQTFSRLGYNLDEALKLSEAANMMSNVANTSVDSATTGLTSIIKAYGMQVSDVEHVSDVLVSLGAHYAISSEELMDAFTRSASALNATGTSFEKSAALLAAANSTIQDSSVIGTALKTVSARLRGSKTDLESLGESVDGLAEGFSKYREEIMALTGFDIMENAETGDFKDIFDIFVGLSENWDKLSETSQARVSEILGGTRQLSVISGIISNISDATNAYSDSMNSAGVSTKANEVYLDSISGKLGQLQSSFQVLSTDVLDSEAVKNVITLLTQLLDILDSVIDKLGVLRTVGLFGGGFAFFKNLD